MKKSIYLMVVVLSVTGNRGFGKTQFNDGQTHNINWQIFDTVWVDYATPGMQTTVNWLDGARIGYNQLYSFNNSKINISGGSIHYFMTNDSSQVGIFGGSIGNLFVNGNSQVSILAGSIDGPLVAESNGIVSISGGSIIGFLQTINNSQVNISNGVIYDQIQACDDSQVSISGGSIYSCLTAFSSSHVNISGGSISSFLYVQGNSQANISGGLIGEELILLGNGILTIEGIDFHVDSQPHTYSEIHSIHSNSIYDEPYRCLTGTLANGDVLNNYFLIGGSAKIVLSPIQPTPPIANAGFDQAVIDTDGNGSEQIILDGSGSSDNDGNIIIWVWTDDLGDTIPEGEIIIATLSLGTHIISLAVTDDKGLKDIDTVTITIEPSDVNNTVCIEYPTMDFNEDCKVDSQDFAIFSQSWLECNLDPPSACW